MKRLSLLLLSFFLVGCSNSSEEKEPDAPITVTQGGQEIYMMYCAPCHGARGDGKGLIQLNRPARSFIDGGFSFGNTIHAIFKTTSSGIPGTPMPPFVDVLNEQQIKLVSMYVRSFAPSLKEATPDETEMIVGNHPVVVRGMIPPVHNGLELHPRGLVVGNPDRFSYEYLADNVRLLAIRQGDFVRRADWGARGGSPLELLGSIIVTVHDGESYQLFTTEDNVPLHAQLTATNTLEPYGIVRYSLLTPTGETVAKVQERCQPTTGTRTLIEQQFSIESSVPIMIHPPSSTDLSRDSLIPAGNHECVITHAIYGDSSGGSGDSSGGSWDSSGGSGDSSGGSGDFGGGS